MKKLIIIVIVISLVYFLLNYIINTTDFFESPVDKMIDRVKQADIISYELEWLVPPAQNSDYDVIDKGNDPKVIRLIKLSMYNIVPFSESGWTYIWLRPIGILRLKFSDGSQERIDVTKACFFAGDNRIETAAFYSVELSNIVAKLFYRALEQYDQLVSAEDLFETLAQGGDLKYIAQPEGKKEFTKRVDKLIKTED